MYERDNAIWSQEHKVVLNRVQIINQIHGCRYDNNVSNPCVYRYEQGHYVVRYCGVTLARYKWLDVGCVQVGSLVLEKVADVLWNGRRLGYMELKPEAEKTPIGEYVGYLRI